MNRVFLLCVLVACGGPEQPTPEPTEPTEPADTPYDLHEWGVLTVSPGVVELAAGPGRRAPPAFDPNMVVEKPIIYVHAAARARFSLQVRLGEGYALAERWPGSGTPIAWQVDANPGDCGQPIAYPTECESADGYCESRELAAYEARDAACLRLGEGNASLLFYRLRAEPSAVASLPVTIESGRATASSARTAWRVRQDARGVQTWRIDLTTQGVEIQDDSAQGAPHAAAWMHRELGRRGLTDQERSAFERAWWAAFFGMVSAEMPDAVERSVEETPPMEEDIPRATSDVLLYFLEDSEITSIARLDATPAPRHIRRAFVVRHQL